MAAHPRLFFQTVQLHVDHDFFSGGKCQDVNQGSLMLHVGVRCAVVSVPCSLVVICWERDDLLAVVFVVLCHFPKCVLVNIRIRGRGWRCETGLSPPVKYFADRSKAVILL